MKPGFYVAREYSHTDKRHLVALESRCFDPCVEISDRSKEEVRALAFQTASNWAAWMDKESPKHIHFVVEVPEELK